MGYYTCIKFYGLIFHVFDWQENSWVIHFCGHGGMVDTIVVGFAEYASYCGLKSMKIYVPQKFLYIL